MGLALLEKGMIFLWLQKYKKRGVPELDVFGLEVLDVLEVVVGFFGGSLELCWHLVDGWDVFIGYFLFVGLHIVRVVVELDGSWLIDHLDGSFNYIKVGFLFWLWYNFLFNLLQVSVLFTIYKKFKLSTWKSLSLKVLKKKFQLASKSIGCILLILLSQKKISFLEHLWVKWLSSLNASLGQMKWFIKGIDQI